MEQSTADRSARDEAHPTIEDARRLAAWRPPLGVISIYLRYEPGDRGGAWRTELRNGIAAVTDASEGLPHDARAAVRATVKRLSERFDDRDARGLPRGEIGFVEVAQAAGEEHWWRTRVPPPVSGASLGDAPAVAALVGTMEKANLRGVALVSAERVRLLEWQPGAVEELENWEIAIFSRDWRERKAQSSSDPARTRGVSSSGHDQFSERLSENRHRFLGECHGLATQIGGRRGWPEILAFGPAPHLASFCEPSAAATPPIERAGDSDLVAIPTGQLKAPIAEAIARISGDRQRELVARVVEDARSHGRGALGAQETLRALEEGRVDHLVLDEARLDLPHRPAHQAMPPATDHSARELDAESLVARALESSARITTVSGAAAESIASADGVAALLRY